MKGKKEFIHGVATRLGIGVYDEGWFQHRLSLFEAITVPSLMAQTCQDFTWLLIIDEKMPPMARQRLDEIIHKVPNAKIIAIEFKSKLRQAIATWAKEEAARRGVDYVMTSRLDDDDAMVVGAYERLHREAEEFFQTSKADKAVFSFNIGSMWDPQSRRGYTRYHDSHSLSLSLLEPAQTCRSVHFTQHKDIKFKTAPSGTYIRGIDGDELWWLYAAHALADSETGDATRLERIRTHRYGYEVDDQMLARFGLDPVAVGRLTELPKPQLAKPVMRLAIRALDIEKEIESLRRALPSASGWKARKMRKQLEALETSRVDAGSGIVASGVAQGSRNRA